MKKLLPLILFSLPAVAASKAISHIDPLDAYSVVQGRHTSKLSSDIEYQMKEIELMKDHLDNLDDVIQEVESDLTLEPGKLKDKLSKIYTKKANTQKLIKQHWGKIKNIANKKSLNNQEENTFLGFIANELDMHRDAASHFDLVDLDGLADLDHKAVAVAIAKSHTELVGPEMPGSASDFNVAKKAIQKLKAGNSASQLLGIAYGNLGAYYFWLSQSDLPAQFGKGKCPKSDDVKKKVVVKRRMAAVSKAADSWDKASCELKNINKHKLNSSDTEELKSAIESMEQAAASAREKMAKLEAELKGKPVK